MIKCTRYLPRDGGTSEIKMNLKGNTIMDLVTGIKERRSIRKFQERQVPHQLLTEVVEVARFAPSWKNTQIARYIVVEDREKIAKLATAEKGAGHDQFLTGIVVQFDLTFTNKVWPEAERYHFFDFVSSQLARANESAS